jgi:transposase InsO family protein
MATCGLAGLPAWAAWVTHHRRRRPPRPAGGSRRAPVPGAGTEPVVGRRSDLREDPLGVGLRGVHHRCVLADGRRLASLAIAALGPRDRRARDGVFNRQRAGADLSHLVHHSDRGVQYLSVRYSERLAENDIVASVGSKGDSYDNALAESFNGLYKWELIYPKGPWRGLDDVEFATLTYVDWFNHRRLHGEIEPTAPPSRPRPSSKPTTTVKHSRPPRPSPNSPSSHATRGGSSWSRISVVSSNLARVSTRSDLTSESSSRALTRSRWVVNQSAPRAPSAAIRRTTRRYRTRERRSGAPDGVSVCQAMLGNDTHCVPSRLAPVQRGASASTESHAGRTAAPPRREQRGTAALLGLPP